MKNGNIYTVGINDVVGLVPVPLAVGYLVVYSSGHTFLELESDVCTLEVDGQTFMANGRSVEVKNSLELKAVLLAAGVQFTEVE